MPRFPHKEPTYIDIGEVSIDDLISDNAQINTSSPEFKELFEDTKKNGILIPITISWRENKKKWFVEDGDHRIICAKILGIKKLKARQVLDWIAWIHCPRCNWSGSQKDFQAHRESEHH